MYDRSVLHLVKPYNKSELRADIYAAYKYTAEKIDEYKARIAELEFNQKELEKDYTRLGYNSRDLENISIDRKDFFY